MSPSRLGRTMPVDKAVEAIAQDRSLFARPIFLRGEGEAFTLHGSNLYRRNAAGPAPVLSAHDLLARWELVTAEHLDAELRGDPSPPRLPRPPRTTPVRSRRGPRSAAEVRLELPAEVRDSYLGVLEAAGELGVSEERIRRAIASGRLSVRFFDRRTLVEAAGVRALFASQPAAAGNVADEAEVYL